MSRSLRRPVQRFTLLPSIAHGSEVPTDGRPLNTAVEAGPAEEGYGSVDLQSGRARRDGQLTEFTTTQVAGRLRRGAQDTRRRFKHFLITCAWKLRPPSSEYDETCSPQVLLARISHGVQKKAAESVNVSRPYTKNQHQPLLPKWYLKN